MQAFHFGNDGQRCFGQFHPAEAGNRVRPAVLICGPIGEEGIRAHRMLRILAERLAASGSPTLRFDYFGTGDSYGDCGDLSLETMQRDILCAHEELVDMTQAARVVWIGLRLGATGALVAAQKPARGPAGIVLWDPVLSGQTYLAELARAHASTPGIGAAAPSPNGQQIHEALGFKISSELWNGLDDMNSIHLKRKPTKRALILTSGATTQIANLEQTLEHLEVVIDKAYDPAEANWNSDNAMNSYFIPNQTINTLVEAIEGWR